jgi:putative GTP pyrophosphokinase
MHQAEVKLHSVSSRVKDVNSFINKAKSKQSEDPLAEIHDVVGIRVVCLFVSDITRIGNLIRNSFTVLSEDDKIEGTDASSFGYMSVHFDVIMKETHKGPRYDPIARLPFEIQVRTIAMDAWANVSHYLDYKSDKDVPSELRKDFYALSGLFYVADRHFEMFYDVSTKSRERMEKLFEAESPEVQGEQEINLDSLTAYLTTKFPERKSSEPKSVSALVNELVKAGIKTIGQVERLVESASEAFIRYEKKHPPVGSDGRYSGVGVVRSSANIADDNYLKLQLKKGFSETDLQRESKRYQEFRKFLKQ